MESAKPICISLSRLNVVEDKTTCHKMNTSNELYFKVVNGKKYKVIFSEDHVLKDVLYAFLDKFDNNLYKEFNNPMPWGVYGRTNTGIKLIGDDPEQSAQQVTYTFDPRMRSDVLDKPVKTLLPKDNIFNVIIYDLNIIQKDEQFLTFEESLGFQELDLNTVPIHEPHYIKSLAYLQDEAIEQKSTSDQKKFRCIIS